jgi:CubicO group peptidase (beta-lactamase class C family)
MVLDERWPSSPLNRPAAHAADPLLRAIWGNPPVFTREAFAWNRPELHTAGVPGAGGIATARAMATFYARLPELLAPATLALATTTLAEGHDAVHDSPARFGVGFQLQTERHSFGAPADAFGHGGAGGSCHGAWPSHGIGFSYISNLMCDHADPDPRPTELLSILDGALGVQEAA